MLEFPGDKLPFINPISQALLAFYPLPNAPDIGPNAYIASQTEADTTDQFGLRVDHYLTSRDVLNLHYIFTQTNATFPLSTAGANVPGFPVGENQRSQNFVAQETHTFSPTVVGLLRFSFLRNKFLFDEHLNHTTPSSLGFQYQPSWTRPLGLPSCRSRALPPSEIRLPARETPMRTLSIFRVRLPGFMAATNSNSAAGMNMIRSMCFRASPPTAFLSFPISRLSNSFASFEFGQPVFFLQGGGDFSRGLRGNNLNVYAQDTFKLTPRLTLNAGLRYELPFPYTEIHNRQNLFEPGVQSQVFPTAPAGLVLSRAILEFLLD